MVKTEIILEEDKFNDGLYFTKDINVEYDGDGPSKGVVEIKDKQIIGAKLCINNNSIHYDGTSSKLSDTNYCNNTKLTITVDENREQINLTDSFVYNYELSMDVLTNMNNISCNNNAVPSLNNNVFTISGVFGETKCVVSSSLTSTINNVDTSKNSVILINDVELSQTATIGSNKSVYLEMNGYTITNNSEIKIYGKLNVFDSTKNGKLIVKDAGIGFNLLNYGTLYIDYANIVQDFDNITTGKNGIWVSSACKGCSVTIKDANIDVGGYAVGFHGNETNSVSNILNGTYRSKKNGIVNAGNSVLSIYNGKFYNDGYVVMIRELVH